MAATALQKIVSAAKKLRKKNPGLTWRAAVDKASAIYRREKKPARKKPAVKKVGKVPAKKSAGKKPVSRHTDTKSHNVNIRVMSGSGSLSVYGTVEEKLKTLIGRRVTSYSRFVYVQDDSAPDGWRRVPVPAKYRYWIIERAYWGKNKGRWYVEGSRPDLGKIPGQSFSLVFEVFQLDRLTDFLTGKIVRDPFTRDPVAKLNK